MSNITLRLPSLIYDIAKELDKRGANAVLVGGSVRDYFLGINSKDYDIEVYAIDSFSELKTLLEPFGKVSLVGRHFGVAKLACNGVEYDFSLPRKESKCSAGHSGFDIEIESSMSFYEASLRRDFTINAIGYSILNAEFLDPHGGIKDIENRELKEVRAKSFIEDPLRVYRCMHFSARFQMSISESLKKLCTDMVRNGCLGELPKERVFDEFKKLLLLSQKPSIGFEFLRSIGALCYFEELSALIDVPQDPKWHPEGDVWIHTMMSIDAMATLRCSEPSRDLILMLAVLCHDFGKPATTTIGDGWISAKRHESVGVPIAQNFLEKLSTQRGILDQVLPLVRHHLAPTQLYNQSSKNSAIRRLATKVNIEDLVTVARADSFGRTTSTAKARIYEAGDWLLERAQNLKVATKPPTNLLRGSDLIELGLAPSPIFTKILQQVYEAQLDGVIKTTDEALEFIRKRVDLNL